MFSGEPDRYHFRNERAVLLMPNPLVSGKELGWLAVKEDPQRSRANNCRYASSKYIQTSPITTVFSTPRLQPSKLLRPAQTSAI